MAREQKRLRKNSSQFIQQFSDSLQSGSTRRTGCCQNEIKKMRINQLSVSWQVTIRHENDVTHSYFQFNSLKFNSACFTGMNDDRLFAPKLHKSKLAGLNNKHLFQIYWEGVHVSVCVCDCASPPQPFTLLSLCVCVRVWECVCHFPPLNTRWGCETCADHQTSLCTVLVLLSSWCHGGWSEEGVTVCVCVCVFGFLGVLFSLSRSGMAALPSEGHWFGQDRHSVTGQTTARQGHSNPSSFYSKQDGLGRRSVGRTGRVKSFPYCPLSMEKMDSWHGIVWCSMIL